MTGISCNAGGSCFDKLLYRLGSNGALHFSDFVLRKGDETMGGILARLAAILVSIQIVMLSVCPADAISVDLAKKCREMAVKAHPPTLPGTKPYARAERDYFRECVSKNGEMPTNDTQKAAPPADQEAPKE